MADLGGFDATKVEPASEYKPLPAGDYRMVIVSSEKKKTKAGTGAYLQIEMQVVDGEHKNRKVTDRLNIWNPSTTAAEIASRTLSAICHAVGVMQPKASEQLHGLPMIVSLAVKERDDKADAYTNEVKGYKKAGVGTSTTKVDPAKTGTAVTAEKAPWE